MNIALIQARMTSTRFPGKSMVKIEGKSILEHMLNGLHKSFLVDMFGIIMPDEEESKILISEFKDKCYIFLGSKNDLIDRYYKSVLDFEKKYKIKVSNIIRLCGDCPLLCFFGNIIDYVLTQHVKEKNDFTHNRNFGGMPSGIDVEIVTRDALVKLNNEVKPEEEREHFSPYLRNNPDKFKTGESKLFTSDYNYKWSIDDIESFNRVSDIFKLFEIKNTYDFGRII